MITKQTSMRNSQSLYKRTTTGIKVHVGLVLFFGRLLLERTLWVCFPHINMNVLRFMVLNLQLEVWFCRM